VRTVSIARPALALAGTALLLASGAAPVGSATAAPAERAPGAGIRASATCHDDGSVARVRGKKADEPKQDPNAKAYGQIKTHPMMPAGSVTIPTVFHMISDHDVTPTEQSRWEDLVDAQVQVLNDSYSGTTADDAADTPFRFELDSVEFVNAPEWYHVAPGKTERDMKKALHTGDSETLNVYAADIGGGLLGWAYFPQGYNHGRAFIDGVVMLDESMPGGTAGKYAEGDTLTHEVGHWLALHHTFQAGCSASNDFVTDTPKEAHPQFNCPLGADTCAAPGLDPIHNFMDYTQDSCMDMFTPGQAQRMNDAWLEFRETD
jgi:hypothetical protein